jgi:phosphodiesterase/alkaline phosphatase D-like protein
VPLTEYPSILGNPFTLGVASGDPLPDGVVLWTRLAPDPLNCGGTASKMWRWTGKLPRMPALQTAQGPLMSHCHPKAYRSVGKDFE